MLAFKSLHQADVGAQTAHDLETVAKTFTSTVQRINVVTGGNVLLQGSLDGENWFTLDTIVLGSSPSTIIHTFAGEHGVRHVRHYADGLTGTNPRVTTWLAPHPITPAAS